MKTGGIIVFCSGLFLPNNLVGINTLLFWMAMIIALVGFTLMLIGIIITLTSSSRRTDVHIKPLYNNISFFGIGAFTLVTGRLIGSSTSLEASALLFWFAMAVRLIALISVLASIITLFISLRKNNDTNTITSYHQTSP